MLSLADYLPSDPATPRLVVARDIAALARVLADRLIATLAFRLKDEWVAHAHIALTGGLINDAVCDALQDSPLRGELDWQKVQVWWTDDSFLPEGHIGRHETRARSAGIARVGIPAANIHPIPAARSEADAHPDRSATEYAKLLRGYAPHGRITPVFDVLLLDVGPQGEIGALYPGHGALNARATEAVVPVWDAPHPPKVRVSLTLPAIRNAARVWFLAYGADRADAVATALTGNAADTGTLPAVGVRRGIETKWWLEEQAARAVPREVRYGSEAATAPTA